MIPAPFTPSLILLLVGLSAASVDDGARERAAKSLRQWTVDWQDHPDGLRSHGVPTTFLESVNVDKLLEDILVGNTITSSYSILYSIILFVYYI